MCNKKSPCRSPAFRNIILLSVALMFTYTATRTLCNAQKYIIKHIRKTNPGYKLNSDYCLAMSFALLSITFWIAPYIIYSTSAKIWLLVFCLVSTIYIGQYLYPITWLTYLTSGMVGITAALSSTAHGFYITINSTQATIQRNSGIFWAILQFHLFLGNLPLYFWVKDKDLDTVTRNYIFGFMLVMCLIGFIIMCFLGSGIYATGLLVFHPVHNWFYRMVRIFCTRDMVLLTFTFIYMGIKHAFIIGVYSNAVGFTMRIEKNPDKALTSIALSGMMIGIGNVTGGIIFGTLGRKIVKFGHYPIIASGGVIHIISYIIIILNLPNQSVKDVTYDNAIIESNYYLALFCSLIMGFGDSCYSTQIIAVIAKKFAAESMAAFSINLFITNASSAAAFLYNTMGLYAVIGILISMCVIGTVSFTYVELYPRFHTTWELPSNSRTSLSGSYDDSMDSLSDHARPWYKKLFYG